MVWQTFRPFSKKYATITLLVKSRLPPFWLWVLANFGYFLTLFSNFWCLPASGICSVLMCCLMASWSLGNCFRHSKHLTTFFTIEKKIRLGLIMKWHEMTRTDTKWHQMNIWPHFLKKKKKLRLGLSMKWHEITENDRKWQKMTQNDLKFSYLSRCFHVHL